MQAAFLFTALFHRRAAKGAEKNRERRKSVHGKGGKKGKDGFF
jgi:hypothetical protein